MKTSYLSVLSAFVLSILLVETSFAATQRSNKLYFSTLTYAPLLITYKMSNFLMNEGQRSTWDKAMKLNSALENRTSITFKIGRKGDETVSKKVKKWLNNERDRMLGGYVLSKLNFAGIGDFYFRVGGKKGELHVIKNLVIAQGRMITSNKFFIGGPNCSAQTRAEWNAPSARYKAVSCKTAKGKNVIFSWEDKNETSRSYKANYRARSKYPDRIKIQLY